MKNQSGKTRILLVDDHALLRRGLADLISYEKDMTVIGEAGDGEAAFHAAMDLKPDLVVMDLMMPVVDGVEATRRIKEALPDTRILVLTTFGTSADVARAVEAGASGAIMKDASTDEQMAAIREVAAGGRVIAPEIKRYMDSNPTPPAFTQRQMQILEFVTQGLSNKEIANHLDISTDAVKQHLAAVCSKLGASNRSEAVSIALRKHLLKI
jgi:DNA-binding NarL/FixJ family response regulator